jgi:hypothetical protein
MYAEPIQIDLAKALLCTHSSLAVRYLQKLYDRLDSSQDVGGIAARALVTAAIRAVAGPNSSVDVDKRQELVLRTLSVFLQTSAGAQLLDMHSAGDQLHDALAECVSAVLIQRVDAQLVQVLAKYAVSERTRQRAVMGTQEMPDSQLMLASLKLCLRYVQNASLSSLLLQPVAGSSTGAVLEAAVAALGGGAPMLYLQQQGQG